MLASATIFYAMAHSASAARNSEKLSGPMPMACIWKGPSASDVSLRFKVGVVDASMEDVAGSLRKCNHQCRKMKFEPGVMKPFEDVLTTEFALAADRKESRCNCWLPQRKGMFSYLTEKENFCKPATCWESYVKVYGFAKVSADRLDAAGGYTTSCDFCEDGSTDCGEALKVGSLVLTEEDLKALSEKERQEALQLNLVFADATSDNGTQGATDAAGADGNAFSGVSEDEANEIDSITEAGRPCKVSYNRKRNYLLRSQTVHVSSCGKGSMIQTKTKDAYKYVDVQMRCYTPEGVTAEEKGSGICAIPRRKPCNPKFENGSCRPKSQCKAEKDLLSFGASYSYVCRAEDD